MKQLPGLVAVAVMVGCLLYALTLSATPRVRVRIAGDRQHSAIYRSHDEYLQAARRSIGTSAMNRSKLTLQRSGIAQAMRSQLPEVTDVRLATPLISRELIITVETQPPGAILHSGGDSYVVDTSGTIVNTLADAPGTDGLPTIEDQTGAPAKVGTTVLSADEIVFIRQLHLQLTAQQLSATAMVLPRGIANELHVRFTGQPYYVKFALNGDVRLQTGSYVAVSRELARQGIVPAEYLDVRVEGRAYYR